ncbi:MAG TPA: multidrug efflux RND transporter permease subunit [Planctomycetota bacterium]|jgi:HAE1 family hydrophobic/amphiphilic exporter-1
MFSKFFIERPILANVIAVVTVIMGLVALYALPVEQFPNITPPTVLVTTTYPGASPEVVASTVAQPIEQQVNGVENMMYMSSTSAANGSYSLTITFNIGTDTNTAQILVQNRVAVALPQLPTEVQLQGVTTKKQSTSIVMFVVLSSPNGTYDELFLNNFASINISDELSRIPGVGDVRNVPGNSYSMRVWLNADEMKSHGVSAQDVINAIRQQNAQVAAGQIGQPPGPPGQVFQFTVQTLGRLSDPAQFENIVLKTAPPSQAAQQTAPSGVPVNSGVNAGRITRLKDVARIELGGQTYDQFFQLNGKPAAGIAISQLPGANALDIAKRIRARMEELKRTFPAGVTYKIPFDTTLFVAQAVSDVYWTLFEAGLLVLAVIVLFLQDWRAVLVPATTIPVTIIGTFIAMAALGFTVNMLTLFGIILAIGIVIDDAIVIVEAAAHNIERGMNSKDAAIHAMDELLGPIIGITLVLMAVFIPAAFLSGITGQLYRQFALTIAATALISAINAVTLKPTQCAQWLRLPNPRKNIVFRVFNIGYEWVETRYLHTLHWTVQHIGMMLVAFAFFLAAAIGMYLSLPAGFLPVDDQGYAIVSALLPDAASLERTRQVTDRINRIIDETPGVATHVSIGGNSILDGSAIPNAATFFVQFKPWDKRTRREESLDGILANLRGEFAKIEEAIVVVFPPPAIRGLGVAGGFQMVLEDHRGANITQLANVAAALVDEGNARSDLASLTTTFRANVPQIYVDVDREKAEVLNVPLDGVFATLGAYLGSTFVNNFNKFGRTFQVRVQGQPEFRTKPEDIENLNVANKNGGMVPLGTLASVEHRAGPQVINRYNLYPSAAINGQAAPGFSSGQALTTMEQLAANALPSGFGFDWTGMSYQEKQASGQAFYAFGFAIMLVYLVLAAQYESLTSPAAVISVVPVALLGAALAAALRGIDNNVYVQIGIVLIIALASKNAILVVDYARELRAQGKSIRDAAVEAGHRRFRPILMTSFAFILGTVPLVIASGAAAASRQALGTAVFGGMLVATILSVAFVPVFYVVWQSLSERVHWKKR